VRGAEGVLLTTRARSAQGSGVSSTQMDAAEAVASLKAAQSLGTTLLDAATAQHALSSKAAVQAQKDFLAQIDPADKGKFAGPVNGQDAAKPTPGSRELDASSPVEKFGAPVVLLDSQAGINWATPASTVLFAGQQLHWTTHTDMHMTAAHTTSSVSAEATSLYAHAGGIQAFAGNGPVSVQAHTDQLEILADQEVTVISVNDGIEVKASKKIVLQAGQASVTLEGSDITFACPGTFSVKGGQHVLDGGANAAAGIAPLPDQLQQVPSAFAATTGPYSLRFAFAGADELAALSGYSGQPFRIVDKAGQVRAQGNVGADGRLPRIDLPERDTLTLQLGNDDWDKFESLQRPAPPVTPDAERQAEAVETMSAMPFTMQEDDDVFLSHDLIALFVGASSGEQET
jgi:type VI secretion system secreted protein VgrG